MANLTWAQIKKVVDNMTKEELEKPVYFCQFETVEDEGFQQMGTLNEISMHNDHLPKGTPYMMYSSKFDF